MARMAQSREIEAKNTLEDSNTGRETSKPSDDEGVYFASPQHHGSLRELWLTPSHRTPTITPQYLTRMIWSTMVVRPAYHNPRR